MFIGHLAVGLAAKRVSPQLSLGALLISCQLLDLIWSVLVLAGVERVSIELGATAAAPFHLEYFPWSHSLGMSLIWAALFALLLKALKCRTPDALVGAVVVFSHWLLDWVCHRPDLPLWLGDTPKLGLGLWHSLPATLVVELALFGAGAWIYSRSTRARNVKGRWVLRILIGLLAAFYVASFFGPEPPVDMPAGMIAGPALPMWLLVALVGAWADRNRRTADC